MISMLLIKRYVGGIRCHSLDVLFETGIAQRHGTSERWRLVHYFTMGGLDIRYLSEITSEDQDITSRIVHPIINVIL